MRIIFAELKKIFSLKNLLPMLLVFLTLFFMFDLYSVEEYYKGDMFEYELSELYGNNLSDGEREDLKRVVKEKKAEFSKILSENNTLANAGITTFEKLDEYENSISYHKVDDENYVKTLIEDKDITDANFEEWYGATREETAVPATDEEIAVFNEAKKVKQSNELWRFISMYYSQVDYSYENGNREKHRDMFIESADYPAAKERIEKFFDSDEYNNITDDFFGAYLNSTTAQMYFITLICVYIFLLPVLTRDNIANMSYLQYSSKAGRKILTKQLVAMITAALSVSLIFIIYLYIVNVVIQMPEQVFTFKLNGFNNVYDRFWLDCTYAEYFIIVSLLLLLFVLAFSLFLFAVSHSSKNYIQAILKSVPVAAVFIGFGFIYAENIFRYGNYYNCLSDILHIPYAEVLLGTVLFVIGLITAMFVIRRNRVSDIL